MLDHKVTREPFWAISPEETLKILKTNNEGLSNEEAINRLKSFGLNAIETKDGFSGLKLFLDQFRSPLIFILILAGIVTIFLKDWVDTSVIFGAVMVNVFLGFYQELKAENVLELLKSYVKTRSRVRRSGPSFAVGFVEASHEEIIDASLLVPGDVIRIAQGDKIPADGRIIFANNFAVDESVLTGESLPAEKKADILTPSVPVSDRTSMVFGSTLAVGGFSDVVITATGIHTEFGRIASLISEKVKTRTPLQIAISRVSMLSGFILLVLPIALFGLGIYLKY